MTNTRFSGLRHRFHPWFIVWLVVMWCMLMGEVTVGNLVAGLIIGVVIVFALPLPAMPIAGIDVSWGKLIAFMIRWFWGCSTPRSRWAGWPCARSRCPRPPSWSCPCAWIMSSYSPWP